MPDVAGCALLWIQPVYLPLTFGGLIGPGSVHMEVPSPLPLMDGSAIEPMPTVIPLRSANPFMAEF
jgi:hypothetical protein